MNTTIFFILLASMVIIAGGMTFLWSTIRRYRRDLGLVTEKGEKTQNVSFIIAAFQDVTRQLKEKEKELERLKSLAEQRADTVESNTENILRSVASGVITFDGNGVITTVNRAAEELLALNRPIGRTCAEIFGSGEVCDAVARMLEQKDPSSRLESPFNRKGERVWIGYNTSLLTDRQGNALGVILSFSDLTEVKRLQEQVELRERLTALGEMSAGIAHELRNPMAVITGYLNLLAKKQDDVGRTTIQDIRSEIDGMNRIIADLLTFARPTALNRTKVDLKDLINGCASSLALVRSANSGIRTESRLDDVEASVDEGLLRQAIANILQNAGEAMTGGGTLTVELRSFNREAVIRIKDSGEGIPPDRIKKIFLPFFTTKDTGVGMGLALAHKIITSHGGRIEVESAVGKGTTFMIILPVT